VKHNEIERIVIQGFSEDLSPDDRPSLGVFGREGSGKTRLAATAPDPIGLIAADKKARRTFEKITREMGKRCVVNQREYVPERDMRKLAMMSDDGTKDDEARQLECKRVYRRAIDMVFEDADALANSDSIETVAMDTANQVFTWMLFKHFGRTTQIPPLSRQTVNQEMIDLVNLLRRKNTVFINQSTEVWKDKTDDKGKTVKAPSGVFEPTGYRNMGYLVNVNVEVQNKDLKAAEIVACGGDEEEMKRKKFRVKVYRCQTNPLIEGS